MGSLERNTRRQQARESQFMRETRERRQAIVNANGAPTKINLNVRYSPGPLTTPVVLPPLDAGDAIVASAFGGATRMEAVASRLLAGAMAYNTLEKCGIDAFYRKRLVEAAVLTAWELIGTAAAYQGPAYQDPAEGQQEAAATSVPAESPDPAASADPAIAQA
jgi:hypothetical protein